MHVSDIPLAHEASRLLPVWVQRRVEAAAELDEEEIEALYEYHAREVLSYGHWTGEVEWDLEELGRYYYHCGRSQALEQILGETRARSIFDRAYEPFNPTFYGVRESELNFDLEIDDPPLETDDDGHIKV